MFNRVVFAKLKIEGAKVGKYTRRRTIEGTLFVKEYISNSEKSNMGEQTMPSIIFANHLHHRNFKKQNSF